MTPVEKVGGVSRRPRVLPWTILVLVPLVVAGGMLAYGQSRISTSGSAATSGGVVPDTFSRLLVAVATVLLACRAMGWLFDRLRQPRVLGDMAAGVILGPSLLGWVWPEMEHWLFPQATLSVIGVLGQCGLILFVFGVGCELDLSALRGGGRLVALVSQATIAVPLLTGVLLALYLYGEFSPPGVQFTAFALFLAAALVVTAVPVLARILVERGAQRSRAGVLALTSAATADVAAWCVLAFVTAIMRGSVGRAVWTLLLSAAFLAVMLYLVRPALRRLVEAPRATVFAVLGAGLALSVIATNMIGVHPVFGALMFGLVVPRGAARAAAATKRMTRGVAAAVLPLFFAGVGLTTRLDLLAGARLWWTAILVTAVGVLSKGVAGAVAARCGGCGRWEAFEVGAMLNCRGVTELIMINLGRQLGLLDDRLFAVLVVMSMVSTAMTAPALSFAARRARPILRSVG